MLGMVRDEYENDEIALELDRIVSVSLLCNCNCNLYNGLSNLPNQPDCWNDFNGGMGCSIGKIEALNRE